MKEDTKIDTYFRISVSLSRFFDDERSKCYLSVSRQHPVRWLERRLRRLFPLPKSLALLSSGHLLPPDEPLALLRPDDQVIVIPSSVTFDSISENDYPANSIEEIIEQKNEVQNSKKRKCYEHHRETGSLPNNYTLMDTNQDEYNYDRSNGCDVVDINYTEISTKIANKTDWSAAEPSGTNESHICNSLENATEERELSEVKAKALALLDSVEAGARRPRRRRARVRRRPAAPAAPARPPPAHSAMPLEEDSGFVLPNHHLHFPDSSSVVQNDVPTTRAPRVIKPIEANANYSF